MYYNEIHYADIIAFFDLGNILFCSEYLGEDHSDVAYIRCRIGQSCIELKQLAKAKEYLKKANDIYQHVPGKSHPFYKNEFLPILKQLRELRDPRDVV